MLFLEIDRSSCRPLSNQICCALRSRILSGELTEGVRLPSTRSLSLELHVSRNTVLTTYDMLTSEGLTVSKSGSGVYVSPLAAHLPVQKPASRNGKAGSASLSADSVPSDCINFDSGLPALALFPRGKWNRAVSRAFFSAPDSALGYDDPQGRPELRERIAAWLAQTRGVRYSADQVLITSGAKQGLTLIAKCLLHSSSTVLMEDPCNANIRQIVSYHTDRILPVPVDAEGLRTDLLPQSGSPALIFTTPSRQFPMGGVLPISRRIELIDYAKRHDSLIVEDDYDSEFRYDGAPVRALFELDDSHVIYVGTFSKVLFPSLRLGYLVLPQPLVASFTEWKRLLDHHSNSVFQLALAQWIESGDLDRHISHMKKIYTRRRQEMLSLLEELFPGQVSIFGDASGLHLVAGFSGASFLPELVDLIRQSGVYAVPVSRHTMLGGHESQLILGFAQLEPSEMRRGLSILRDCLCGSNIKSDVP